MNSAPAAVAFRATIQLDGPTASACGVALDAEPRAVMVPPDFVDALAGDGEAARYFADLSSANQRRVVRAIERSRTHETRRRRIANAVSTLRAGCV
jgi:uncharacterized protein YdeI (YjbR/CyaY-like superfamily)